MWGFVLNKESVAMVKLAQTSACIASSTCVFFRRPRENVLKVYSLDLLHSMSSG